MTLTDAIIKLNNELLFAANQSTTNLAWINTDDNKYYLDVYESQGANLYKKETYEQIRQIISEIPNKHPRLLVEYIYTCICFSVSDKNILYTLLANISDEEIVHSHDIIDDLFENLIIGENIIKCVFELCLEKPKLYELFHEHHGHNTLYLMKEYVNTAKQAKILMEKLEYLEKQVKELENVIAHYQYKPDGPGYQLAKKEFDMLKSHTN